MPVTYLESYTAALLNRIDCAPFTLVFRLVICTVYLTKGPLANFYSSHKISKRRELLLVTNCTNFLFLSEYHVTVIIRGFCGDTHR